MSHRSPAAPHSPGMPPASRQLPPHTPPPHTGVYGWPARRKAVTLLGAAGQQPSRNTPPAASAHTSLTQPQRLPPGVSHSTVPVPVQLCPLFMSCSQACSAAMADTTHRAAGSAATPETRTSPHAGHPGVCTSAIHDRHISALHALSGGPFAAGGATQLILSWPDASCPSGLGQLHRFSDHRGAGCWPRHTRHRFTSVEALPSWPAPTASHTPAHMTLMLTPTPPTPSLAAALAHTAPAQQIKR
jgi:hypothetical protein